MDTPDHNALQELLEWRPEHGAVSVYLTVEPADRREGWRIALRDGLKRLVDAAHDEGPRERWLALRQTADRIIDAFPPEGQHPEGRCQVCFAEVSESSGRQVRYSLQMAPRDTVVVHEAVPYLRPLVELLDDGGPLGVLAVSSERVRLWRWSLGRIEEVDQWEFSFEGDSRERKGPSPRDPARGQGTSSSGREQYGQRLEAHRERWLKSVGEGTGRHLGRAGWSKLLAFGGEPQVQLVEQGLGPQASVHHVDEHNVVSEDGRHLEERIEALLPELNRARELALVERAKSAVYAQSGGGAALGVQETLEALAQGRVEHLIFDAERDYRGAPIDAELVGDERAGAGSQPRLAERMIEQAIRTSAAVTPLEGEAAAALEEHGGVAALLRY